MNCSISSIRTLVRNKAIPYFRIGSKLNFKKEAVDNWIHNQEIQNMQNEAYSIKIKSIYEKITTKETFKNAKK